jgi:hypothetical protein
MNPAEMPKSEMLRRSMRCFVLGWWSLVPFIGFGVALLAFVDLRAVVLGVGRRWNAGRTRLLVGAWMAGLGFLLNLGFITLVILAILQAMGNG